MNFTNSKLQFVFAIPIIMVLVNLTTGFFPSTSINPGNIRAVVFLIFIVSSYEYYFKNNNENKLLLVFLIYLFTLCFLSSNITYALYVYIKLLITTLMFPIGYYYINNPEKYIKINKSIYTAFWFVIIGTLVSMYYGIGETSQGDEETTFGVFGLNISKDIAVLSLILVHAFITKQLKVNSKYIFLAILFVGIFLVFISVKRGSILALIFGLTTYLIFIPKSQKIFRYILIPISIGVVASPLYLSKIEDRFSYREDLLTVEHYQEEDIKEWRVIETDIAINAFKEKNIAYKLFGFELFNGMSYFKMPYMFHNDFAVLLAGSGIVGVVLYVLFYLSLLKKIMSIRSKNRNIMFQKALIYALLVMVLFISISGHIKGIGVRAVIMLYLGATLSQLNYNKNNESRV